jgi:hypothetical protein
VERRFPHRIEKRMVNIDKEEGGKDDEETKTQPLQKRYLGSLAETVEEMKCNHYRRGVQALLWQQMKGRDANHYRRGAQALWWRCEEVKCRPLQERC